MEVEPELGLRRRLRQADGEELLALVRERAGDLGPEEARQALANPFAGSEVIELLAAHRGLVGHYEVRRTLAFHPRTPEPLALRFVAGLYGRDLLSLGLDTRARPTVRRAGERYLIQRLAGLSVGEKTAVARRASPGVLVHLRHDPSPRVIAGMLDNPRLTEGTLAPLVHKSNAQPEVLKLIAEDHRWGVRYPIRLAISRNPRTPVATALRLLPLLKRPDQLAVATDHRLHAAVRRRARLLSGGG